MTYSRALLGRLRIQDSSELTDHKACDNKLSIRACVSRWDFGSASAGAMAARPVFFFSTPEIPEYAELGFFLFPSNISPGLYLRLYEGRLHGLCQSIVVRI